MGFSEFIASAKDAIIPPAPPVPPKTEVRVMLRPAFVPHSADISEARPHVVTGRFGQEQG